MILLTRLNGVSLRNHKKVSSLIVYNYDSLKKKKKKLVQSSVIVKKEKNKNIRVQKWNTGPDTIWRIIIKYLKSGWTVFYFLFFDGV